MMSLRNYQNQHGASGKKSGGPVRAYLVSSIMTLPSGESLFKLTGEFSMAYSMALSICLFVGIRLRFWVSLELMQMEATIRLTHH